MNIQINNENCGERIDKFLTSYFEEDQNKLELTRSQIQKLIKNGKIFLNGNSVEANYKTKDGDKITIDLKKVKEEKEITKIYLDLDKAIIENAENYLVVNKPAGIVVHPADQINEETLIEKVLEKYPQIKNVGDDQSRPGIVHRLDKEVSGLMVIAKTQKSFNSLKKQFKDRTIEKEYLALVHGNIDKDDGTIDFPITRSTSRYKMAAIPKTQKGEVNVLGRNAITKFWVLKRFINYTYIRVKIITGRTHQIRAHMSAFGTPIVGDNIYTTNKLRGKNKKFKLGRIFLVANKLSFNDLDGNTKSFETELPKNLEDFLNKAK